MTPLEIHDKLGHKPRRRQVEFYEEYSWDGGGGKTHAMAVLALSRASNGDATMVFTRHRENFLEYVRGISEQVGIGDWQKLIDVVGIRHCGGVRCLELIDP